MFYAKTILDSLAPCGRRLTTIEIRFPRIILPEVLTHRDRERNSASSRAIPWSKMRDAVVNEPFVPLLWGAEQKGMQTGGEIEQTGKAEEIWLKAARNAVESAQELANLGVHKSLCNRLVEPFSWMTVVMTATEWNNFYRLRCHPDAEIHFQMIANLSKSEMQNSVPQPPPPDAYGWHLPYVTGYDLEQLSEFTIDGIKRISTGRLARVSYLTQDGVRDARKDIDLFDRLSTGSGFGHWSPAGHVAYGEEAEVRSGPFVGWSQFRKEFPNENEAG